MEILLKYIEYYISLYNENLSDFDKLNIFKSITTLYEVSTEFIEHNDTYIKIKEIYNRFLENKIIDNNDMFKSLKKYFENLNDIRLFKDDDIKYIFELLTMLDTQYYLKTCDNFDNINLLNYINGNKDYLNLINYMKNKTIIDKRFNNCCQISLYNDELILLNSNSIIDYIHELTHVYTRNINSWYLETFSILMELGISSFYKLGDKNGRIYDLNLFIRKNLNKWSLKVALLNKLLVQKDLEYILGTIISLGFIYNNGNSFNDIKKAVDIICYNSDKSITQILNILNIKESDIVNGVKRKELILGKNEAYFR